MAEILGWYAFLFKWQFTNLWFYVWLVFLVVISWGKKSHHKTIVAVAISVVFMPVLIMLMKWVELFSR